MASIAGTHWDHLTGSGGEDHGRRPERKTAPKFPAATIPHMNTPSSLPVPELAHLLRVAVNALKATPQVMPPGWDVTPPKVPDDPKYAQPACRPTVQEGRRTP